MYRFLIFILSLSVVFGRVYANHNQDDYYRNFWSPQYHARSLDYCSCNNSVCGKKIADGYCRKMGYKKADKYLKEYNVGLTYALDGEGSCVGWQCHGFKLIRCVADLPDNVPQNYSYRKKQFNYPRLDEYRVDWCYKNQSGCGKKVAQSFCRRLGFMKSTHYEIDKNIAATRNIGSRELCFGKHCNGFKKIICYR
tara:strand:+ start:2554 stop:3138 length:585 start_codon:yes stop_codon:yes gene_type:complete